MGVVLTVRIIVCNLYFYIDSLRLSAVAMPVSLLHDTVYQARHTDAAANQAKCYDEDTHYIASLISLILRKDVSCVEWFKRILVYTHQCQMLVLIFWF